MFAAMLAVENAVLGTPSSTSLWRIGRRSGPKSAVQFASSHTHTTLRVTRRLVRLGP